jgi:hypothetical protein
LEILDETYSKTKNSLDENTTFLIGILKILNNSNSTNSVPKKIKQVKDKCIYSEIEEKDINTIEIEDIPNNKIINNEKQKTIDSYNKEGLNINDI